MTTQHTQCAATGCQYPDNEGFCCKSLVGAEPFVFTPMPREEAAARLLAAKEILIANGWTERQFELMTDGMYREDAVAEAERHAGVQS